MVLAALGTALIGLLGGGFAGVVIVDYTDANASHTALDLAVVAACAFVGLVLTPLLSRRWRPGPADRGRTQPPA